MAWEYLHVIQENKWIDASEFNRRGEHGWELVSVVTMVVPTFSQGFNQAQTDQTSHDRWSQKYRDGLVMETSTGSVETYHESSFYCIAYFKRLVDDYLEVNLDEG